MKEVQEKRKCRLPPLTLGREIGGTLYVVQAEFSPTAAEAAEQKVKRLLLKEIEENHLKSG